ncbi:MAG: methyltransferase domain-containing protein [Chloroflexi bacterium]|nr:methyltransferase domain-containing protein [Chloroflexota bacterium]
MNTRWDALWAPYDEDTYAFVLEQVTPDDVVVDIGAGDLRLAFRLAQRVRRVYAIERQPHLVARALQERQRPANLFILVGDARVLPFPPDVTIGVLLMRHSPDVALYWAKLQERGARGLVTNARWGLGPEYIDINAPRVPFEHVQMGWYACRCGATGFIPGPPEEMDEHVFRTIHEVANCPVCNGEQLTVDDEGESGRRARLVGDIMHNE